MLCEVHHALGHVAQEGTDDMTGGYLGKRANQRFACPCSRLTRFESVKSAIGVLIPVGEHAFVKFEAEPQKSTPACVVRSAKI